jgi:hypothetical protein
LAKDVRQLVEFSVAPDAQRQIEDDCEQASSFAAISAAVDRPPIGHHIFVQQLFESAQAAHRPFNNAQFFRIVLGAVFELRHYRKTCPPKSYSRRHQNAIVVGFEGSEVKKRCLEIIWVCYVSCGCLAKLQVPSGVGCVDVISDTALGAIGYNWRASFAIEILKKLLGLGIEGATQRTELQAAFPEFFKRLDLWNQGINCLANPGAVAGHLRSRVDVRRRAALCIRKVFIEYAMTSRKI